MTSSARHEQRVVIHPYSETWPRLFAELGARLRAELGDVALRIDHVGSTAVPGLGAKPIVDVQISVARLDPIDAFRAPLGRLGFVHRADNPERTKRYFREAPGARRTHIHVRQAGTFSEQVPLLFRDYLRANATSAAEYEAVKRRCADEHARDRQGYVEAKSSFVWEVLKRADEWAQHDGWIVGPSDA
jgi:GrpB-like predicted nucleotidyltransferase (UPF0157 family)